MFALISSCRRFLELTFTTQAIPSVYNRYPNCQSSLDQQPSPCLGSRHNDRRPLINELY